MWMVSLFVCFCIVCCMVFFNKARPGVLTINFVVRPISAMLNGQRNHWRIGIIEPSSCNSYFCCKSVITAWGLKGCDAWKALLLLLLEVNTVFYRPHLQYKQHYIYIQNCSLVKLENAITNIPVVKTNYANFSCKHNSLFYWYMCYELCRVGNHNAVCHYLPRLQ